jgi:hypothetical protein
MSESRKSCKVAKYDGREYFHSMLCIQEQILHCVHSMLCIQDNQETNQESQVKWPPIRDHGLN